MSKFDRRRFLRGSAAVLSAATAGRALAQEDAPPKAPASERLQVGCIGVGGRASALVNGFVSLKEVDVVALCDIERGRLEQAAESLKQRRGAKPTVYGDVRKLIDDPKIDAVVVGAPDHWHAIPTILACLADKDVYVEKPDGHNIVEGQRMVAAMRKHKRIVQLGTQSRSSRHFVDAIEHLRSGKLGRCLVAKAWESGKQGGIGRPADGEVPEGVDYDTWLGPAPKRPFNPARFHGNWRWFFDYGTGDLGNDGVHRLDVARWALSAAMEGAGEGPLPALPKIVSTVGGKWYFDDAQEWPDTLQVDYQYDLGPERAGRILTYEMRVWNPYPYHGMGEGVAVFGDKGWMLIGNGGWRVFGRDGQTAISEEGRIDDAAHIQNFIDCVKSRKKPNADLETIGHPSSVLCHAGNIAWRTGRKLTLDAETETFVDEGAAEANRLLTRPEYRKPWTLPEIT
jgi:predicted dehydrogenase